MSLYMSLSTLYVSLASVQGLVWQKRPVSRVAKETGISCGKRDRYLVWQKRPVSRVAKETGIYIHLSSWMEMLPSPSCLGLGFRV
jgi:hypothetical protein